MTATSYLSLGSNIGDRLEYLSQAVRLLNELETISVVNVSSVYETAAWGLVNQPDFYNIVLEITTNLSPKRLLTECQKIEQTLDRTRAIHWGPRTIDIDILLYEKVELNDESLTIPHKYLLKRPFVTIPLAEIAPDIEVKKTKISTIAKHHSQLEEKCQKVVDIALNFTK